MKRPFDFTKLRMLLDEFDAYARPFEAEIVERDKKFLVERANSYSGISRLAAFDTRQAAEDFRDRWENRFPGVEAELLDWFAKETAELWREREE